MDNYYNRYYIATDLQGRITDGWSDGPFPERDTADAICINEQGSYQFRLTPGGEENPPLRNMEGIPLYKWDGEQAVPRSEEEIAADITAIPPSPPTEMEKMRADLDYVMLMNGFDVDPK